MSDAKKALDEANKLLEELKDYKAPAIQITDLSEKFNKLVSADLVKAMEPKLTTLIGKVNDEQYVVKYFSVTTRDVDKAMAKLAEYLEACHAKYGVMGTLAKCSSIDLYVQDINDMPKAVFVFVGIPFDRSKEFDKEHFPGSHKEGELGPKVE